jgi:predicted transcriptional regulator YheO
MQKIGEELELLTTLVDVLAKHFGQKCEVVLHDYSKPIDQTIVAIENGHVTKRKVGGHGTNLGLALIRGTETAAYKSNYLTQTPDGKVLRSSTVYVRNKQGKPIGSLCINNDITELIMAEKVIAETINHPQRSSEQVYTDDVNDLLDVLIRQSIDYVGVPVALMDKEQKTKGLKYLDKKGAFLIKKAGDKIAKYYDISKYTIYNYLETENDADKR